MRVPRSSTLSVATKASPMAGTGLAAPAKRKASQDLSGSVGSAADKSESAAGAVGEKMAKKRARPELEVKDEGHRMEVHRHRLRRLRQRQQGLFLRLVVLQPLHVEGRQLACDNSTCNVGHPALGGDKAAD